MSEAAAALSGGVAGVFLSILVDGAPLNPLVSDRVIEVEVETNLSLPDEIVIVFSDPDHLTVEMGGFVPGSLITVLASVDTGIPEPWPISIGEITAIEVKMDHRGTLAVIHGQDTSNRLMRGRTTMAYPEALASEIVAMLAAEAMLIPGVTPTDTVYPVLTQANQSNWDFIQQLARESGMIAYASLGTLWFREPIVPPDTPPPPELASEPLLPGQLFFGVNLQRISTSITAADQVADVQVLGWDPMVQMPVVGVGPSVTGATLNMVQPEELGGIFGANSFVFTDVPYDDEGQAETAAMSIAQRLATTYTVIDGEASGSPWLNAGFGVAIGGTGLTFDGMYLVSSSRHRIGPGGQYVTEFTCSGQQDITLGGLANSSWQQSKRHLIPGVATGVVTAVWDPESPMPDAIPPLNPQPGQVKLMFPWLAVEPPYVSDWCRVVQVGAGAEFGNILLPDPGSEVLVAFDHGDIRRPYVIGTMYNGLEEMIPQVDCTLTTEGFANQRVYQSRLGSMLYFNDSPETPSVTLQAGEVPDMLSLKFMIEEGSITLSCLGETGISIMAPSGPVSIECMDLSITAEASISLTAPDITIAGEASVTITGAAIELDGDASVMVSAPAVMLGE